MLEKAEEALKSYKTQIDGGSRGGQNHLDKTEGIAKSKSVNIGKKLPTPPKKPSSSGKRFRGRSEAEISINITRGKVQV